jgi:hypothetical protein
MMHTRNIRIIGQIRRPQSRYYTVKQNDSNTNFAVILLLLIFLMFIMHKFY